jgi:hypothetical protein
MGISTLELYQICNDATYSIRPSITDIRKHLGSESYLIDSNEIPDAGLYEPRLHPCTPIIIVPVDQFIQIYWKTDMTDGVRREICGGAPHATCFKAIAIPPGTIYAIRNIMAVPTEINRYRPRTPYPEDIPTIHTQLESTD